MLKRVNGATLNGIDGELVCVEVEAGRGLPSFSIVGRGDRVVSESRDRIRAAFRSSGIEFPPGRVTVNLAPTDRPKTGASLDLPIAIGIAATRLDLPEERLRQVLLIGELGLDGRLRPVRGVLALLAAARARGLREAVTPDGNLAEASVLPDLRALGARELGEVLHFLAGEVSLSSRSRPELALDAGAPELDLAEVRGQETAKRALEIAAAGGHNLLMLGPPGGGKTLLARRLPALLPDLPFEHALEVTRIHSVAGLLAGRALVHRAPFRAPHHSASDVGITGGGRPFRPGEMSLAHRGVLLLDELAEFRRPVLEALRQPLEEGQLLLARAHGVITLPARFQLIAAMNPCPCGYLGCASRECLCDEAAIRRYRLKLSGPLLDRIDLQVFLPPLPWGDIVSPATGGTTREARQRIAQARAFRESRGASQGRPQARATLHGSPSPAVLTLLERSGSRLGLSMRGVDRALRVARTIADLAGEPELLPAHLAEALSFRLTGFGVELRGGPGGSALEL